MKNLKPIGVLLGLLFVSTTAQAFAGDAVIIRYPPKVQMENNVNFANGVNGLVRHAYAYSYYREADRMRPNLHTGETVNVDCYTNPDGGIWCRRPYVDSGYPMMMEAAPRTYSYDDYYSRVYYH